MNLSLNMPNLTVSLIQTDLHWENRKANLSMLEEKIRGIQEPTALIVLPEMFNTGFSMNPEDLGETITGETVLWMKKMAAEKKCILTGSIIIKEKAPDGTTDLYYNRLVWMFPDGNAGYYDKRHLFAYANEHIRFSKGSRRLIGSVNGWKINLQICYDLRFPVWARQFIHKGSAPEYDALLIVANWPKRRQHAWKTLLQARAIENQCFVIAVNRTGTDGNDIEYSGGSVIVNPLGEIVHDLKDQEFILTATLEKEVIHEVRNKFPFWKDADSFFIEP